VKWADPCVEVFEVYRAGVVRGAMGMPLYVAVLFLAPLTSGPRDVPRCGALRLHQKTPNYRERTKERTE
jgi:hypothetical protein